MSDANLRFYKRKLDESIQKLRNLKIENEERERDYVLKSQEMKDSYIDSINKASSQDEENHYQILLDDLDEKIREKIQKLRDSETSLENEIEHYNKLYHDEENGLNFVTNEDRRQIMEEKAKSEQRLYELEKAEERQAEDQRRIKEKRPNPFFGSFFTAPSYRSETPVVKSSSIPVSGLKVLPKFKDSWEGDEFGGSKKTRKAKKIRKSKKTRKANKSKKSKKGKKCKKSKKSNMYIKMTRSKRRNIQKSKKNHI